MPLYQEEKTSYGSIQKFKTFTPPSIDREFVFAQLCKNVENACVKLRRYNQAANKVAIVLRTQQFDHAVREIQFERATNLPTEMLPLIRGQFQKMFCSRTFYRATGLFAFDLAPMSMQADLFDYAKRAEKFQKVYASTDKVAAKYGKHSLFLGASWKAHRLSAHLNERGDDPKRKNELFVGETKRRRLNIPMLTGEGI